MKKVLLIEDDMWLAQMYQDAFDEVTNIDVAVAANADEVFAALDKSSFNLILLDLFLPEHSGIALLHEIASYEDTLSLPVMILSSISPSEAAMNQERWSQYGVVEYLYKPLIKPRDLVARLKKFFTAQQEATL